MARRVLRYSGVPQTECARPQSAGPHLKGARILVVDDAEPVRSAMADILRLAGADVSEAASGEEVLRRAARGRPDLIVLDLDLPDADGLEICRRIKADPRTRSTLVLLLSGVYLDVADRVRGLEGGADGYLTKPVERMELLATTGALLRLHDSERRRRSAETVAQVAQALTETLDVAEVASRIVECLPALFDLRAATVRLLQPDGSLLTVASGGPACEHYEVGQISPAGTGVVGWAIAEGRAVSTTDMLADSRIRLTDEQRQRAVASACRSVLAVPLRVRGQLLGALGLAEEDSRAFSDAEVALLQTVADQAALAIENARLYEDARRAYRELSNAQDQLRQSQKMEAIGRLASGVAHDFNNLLTVIQGRSELMRNRLAPNDPLYRHTRLIETTTARAAALTRQLLAFSRKQVLQPKVLDLNHVLAGMEKMLRRLIGEDIDLILIADPALDRVRADPAQIEQVILNLVVNSRDAMPNGGRLVVETANLRVEERGDEAPDLTPGSYVLLAVGDSGVGMDEETRSHVFEPFFTTKEPGIGSGLGLATVYGIVKQSGGEVGFETEVDRGTTFRIYLPAVPEPVESLAPDRSPLTAPRGIETILLVEDDDALREMTREMLALYGYRVIDARHPGEALLVAERRPDRIDLLVTDVVMPQMNGRELADRLLELRPNLRVLYISGYADDALIHRAGMNGEVRFLAKPFSADGLADRVRAALDGAPRTAGLHAR